MGVAWADFAEGSLLTTWTPTTPGAHHGRPEVTLISQTTTGLTLPSPAALPFTVAALGPSGPLPPLCQPPSPWAPSEAGQEPPRPLGPGSRLPPHRLLHHPPPLQSPGLRQAPLSSAAGKVNKAASHNSASKLPLTSYWYTGIYHHSPVHVLMYSHMMFSWYCFMWHSVFTWQVTLRFLLSGFYRFPVEFYLHIQNLYSSQFTPK